MSVFSQVHDFVRNEEVLDACGRLAHCIRQGRVLVLTNLPPPRFSTFPIQSTYTFYAHLYDSNFKDGLI